MQSRSIITKIIPLIILPSAVFAFDLIGSAENMASNAAKNAINKNLKGITKNINITKLLGLSTSDIINANLINIPGFLGVGFKCSLNKKIPVFNICKLIGKESSSKFKLSLGPCSLSVGASDECFIDLAKKWCGSETEKNIETPLKTMNAAAKNLTTTGNTFIKQNAWNDKCVNFFGSKKDDIIKNPNGVSVKTIRNTYFTPQVVYKKALPSTGATNIFDPKLKDWEECVFLNSKGGSDALNKCNDLKDEQMPLTEEAVYNNIDDSIPFLLNGTDDIMNDDYKNLYTYKADYIKECSNAQDVKSCEENLWENGFTLNDGSVIKPKDIYQKQLSNTEKANARFASIVEKATAKDKEVIFMSQSFINTLPPVEQKKYEFLAQKAMYQKVLNKYFLKKITDLEEESISINYDAEKVAASPFYPTQALTEIQQMIAAFSSPAGSASSGSSLGGIHLPSMPSLPSIPSF